jgi:SAM-dependent methyltransferase
MSNPEQLSMTDDRGRRILGYTTASGDGQEYAAFADMFRGSEEFVRERQRAYLPLLRRHALVVDIGCGRGEMLDLLREAAIAAVGVDVDASMVARSRAKGHAVEQTDALSYLERQPDGSVPAIFSAQVVEHMPYETFRSLLTLSRAKLVGGGQLVFETVNPHSLEAFKTFYTDLTHQRPIFPEVAVTLCRLAGFAEAFVFYPNGTGDQERDRKTQGEYAAVATAPRER